MKVEAKTGHAVVLTNGLRIGPSGADVTRTAEVRDHLRCGRLLPAGVSAGKRHRLRQTLPVSLWRPSKASEPSAPTDPGGDA